MIVSLFVPLALQRIFIKFWFGAAGERMRAQFGDTVLSVVYVNISLQSPTLHWQ